MRFFFIIFILNLIALSLASIDQEWDLFKKSFNKVYTLPNEEAYRRSIWEVNRNFVENFNSMNPQFHLKINQFGDLTAEEYKRIALGLVVSRNIISKNIKNTLNSRKIFTFK
ncbi:unnamed protein product [Brachionus calyciflorus]|uniref:Cathepsin propeptide inhibitor domain-containing protein n=1 Tax=Brachionus calyciflorus TaxID=104777 RepID=A0A814AA42_9BILA|nr:unnamed protein product [Brachionus calyciflorus]